VTTNPDALQERRSPIRRETGKLLECADSQIGASPADIGRHL
jgi:hypothetical protein